MSPTTTQHVPSCPKDSPPIESFYCRLEVSLNYAVIMKGGRVCLRMNPYVSPGVHEVLTELDSNFPGAKAYSWL
jgi:hypothetical protein